MRGSFLKQSRKGEGGCILQGTGSGGGMCFVKGAITVFMTLLFGMKAPGLGRLSFTLEDKGDHRRIDVRAWWHPHGMPGLFYWLLMIPAHLFIFRGMAKRIAQRAEQKTGKI